MQILILGGTQFLGRNIAEELLQSGHTLTIFNRGRTPDPLPSSIERLRGDRDRGHPGLASLANRTWDLCIDVSGYTAQQVRPSAELLQSRIHRYIYISAVSAYNTPPLRPVLESYALAPTISEDVTELTNDTYGRLKATCESIIGDLYGDHATFLRPQIVVGPGDYQTGYRYWLQRAARGGEMLAPGNGTDHLQVIDIADLTRFVNVVVSHDLHGPYNLAGPRLTWANFIELLAPEKVTWIPTEILTTQNITEFQLPLYRPEHSPRAGLMDISCAKAQSAGLTHTPPAITLQRTRPWATQQPFNPPLPPETESHLLQLAQRS